MPALQLFGRKWLAATDDMVFPGLFEFSLRLLWLSLLACATSRYYGQTYTCQNGGDFVRFYLVGMLTILAAVMCTLIVLINRSAQGSITDTSARRFVPHIVAFKIFLLLPEVGLNILGTIWAFSNLIECDVEKFTCHVIEGLVVFDWGLFALTILGLAFVFDPIGSVSYYEKFNNTDVNVESVKHKKITRLWMKRFRWFFCWLRKDAHCHEAFQHVAGGLCKGLEELSPGGTRDESVTCGKNLESRMHDDLVWFINKNYFFALFSSMFRSTDLVPSDVIAGCVLLRVKQKRKTRETRRLQLKSDKQPRASTDVREVFATAPQWMCIKKAKHYMSLAISVYSWPFVMYRYCVTGLFRLVPEMMCCFCFRTKSTFVTGDNCCLCNLAGVKYISKIAEEDILFASFKNHVFELPFCVIADHKTSSIVIAVRGSLSLRDIFTDLTAGAEKFEAEGLPPNSMAHKGMIAGAKYLKRRLEEVGVLERACAMYPHYDIILTGHSLGAGVAILLGILMRPVYPKLKVYAFATPAGLLSREAARQTESFVLTVGVGDDFVMRLGVESMENLRCKILQVLAACRLPKYRIMINGFGYVLFGVPSKDLESTWRTDMSTAPSSAQGQLPLLYDPYHTHVIDNNPEANLLAKDVTLRRFSRARLFTAGRILHISRRKKTKQERKAGTGGPTYEMRWATPEEFTEIKVEPRMLLDHLPENVDKVLETVLLEQRIDISDSDYRRNRISVI